MQRPVQTKLFQLPARAFEDQSSVDQSVRTICWSRTSHRRID